MRGNNPRLPPFFLPGSSGRERDLVDIIFIGAAILGGLGLTAALILAIVTDRG